MNDLMNKDYYNNYSRIQDLKNNYITVFLVVVNIAVFIIYTILGDVLYNITSLSAVDITDSHEYYRFFTCMFMHGSLEHLLSNMLFLAVLGDMLERAVGHGRFIVIYMVSGRLGGCASVLYALISGNMYSSVGASGAISGLIGALLVLVIKNNGRYGQVSLRRMILGIVYLIYSGLQSNITDNAAHIGGMAAGFFVMILLYVFNRKVKVAVHR